LVCLLTVFSQAVKKLQTPNNNFLHRFDGPRQDLIGHNFVRLLGEAGFQSTPPGKSNFGIDVDNSDSRGDCLAQILVVGSRATVQRQPQTNCGLNLTDSLDIQSLPVLAIHHTLQHSVHIAHGRS
jgi:hypothetical protein